jgi:anaerobic magnesium-protoporphyrin IX monomethyl ester cyclase
MTTSRGCPYECAFCSPRGFWHTFRSFSPQRVVDEISLLVDQYKVDGIMIWDDLFAVNKKRLRQIVELLEQQGITGKIEFAVFARANLFDEEIVTLLQRMRVTSVIFGLESGSERILNYLKKGTVTVEQNYRALRLCKEHGMRTRATLIIGSPDETQEDLEQTAKLFKSPDIDEPIICHLTPLPGTEVWAHARDLGLVRDDIDWDYASLTGWDFDPRLIMTAHVSPEELHQSYDDLAQWGAKRLQEDRRDAIGLKYLFNWRLLTKVARNWRKYARLLIAKVRL